MNRTTLKISVTVWIMVSVLGLVTLLSTETKLYAVECWGCGKGSCQGTFTCIPHVRNWNMFGTDDPQSFCESGAGLYTFCTTIPQGGWCMEWQDCDDECINCITDEESSFPLNICVFDKP